MIETGCAQVNRDSFPTAYLAPLRSAPLMDLHDAIAKAKPADPKRTPNGLEDFLGKPLSRGADADMGAYASI